MSPRQSKMGLEWLLEWAAGSPGGPGQPKTRPRQPQASPRQAKLAQDGAQDSPRLPKLAQASFRWPPRGAQDSPKLADDRPKTAASQPQTSPKGPKFTQDRAQDSPRWPALHGPTGAMADPIRLQVPKSKTSSIQKSWKDTKCARSAHVCLV
jgi:hypothetical protein